MIKKYHTIFLGDKLYTNVVDDMNTTEIWTIGGMLWHKKKTAEAYLNHIKKYDLYSDKFTVKEVIVSETPNLIGKIISIIKKYRVPEYPICMQNVLLKRLEEEIKNIK